MLVSQKVHKLDRKATQAGIGMESKEQWGNEGRALERTHSQASRKYTASSILLININQKVHLQKVYFQIYLQIFQASMAWIFSWNKIEKVSIKEVQNVSFFKR